MSPNVGEYGLALNLNVSYNLAAATSLQIVIERPDKTKITGTPVMGQTPIVSDKLGTFVAQEYAVYLIQDGDLNQPGNYIVRLIYTDSTKRLISDPTSFTVSS